MKAALIALVCALIIGLSGAVALAEIQGEARPAPTIGDFPVQPGDASPETAWCSYSVDYDHVYCQARMDGRDVYFSRDLRTDTVRTISYRIEETAIGELMARWGLPTGEVRTGLFRRVYWGDKSALVFSKRFTPQSPAWFVTLGLKLDGVTAWQGFSAN